MIDVLREMERELTLEDFKRDYTILTTKLDYSSDDALNGLIESDYFHIGLEVREWVESINKGA